MEGRLAVFFRGLGGLKAVEIKASPPQTSAHRLSLLGRLGRGREKVARASFDGEALRLPERVALFSQRRLNEGLYFWLVACAAHSDQPDDLSKDPLRADLQRLRAWPRLEQKTLLACPGLSRLRLELARASRATRPITKLPPQEAALEEAILQLLGGAPPQSAQGQAFLSWIRAADGDRDPAAALKTFRAPPGYHTFRPVPLWLDLLPLSPRALVLRENDGEEAGASKDPQDEKQQQKTFRAKRENADEADRKDSLVLYRFEAIFSWTEFLNLNRRIDDEDDDNAKQAADDLEEVSLAENSKVAATKLKLHLDLSPEDAECERLSGKHLYPEWDHRTQSYLPDHCRVLASQAETGDAPSELLKDPAARRRIQSVRKRFEALRPKRVLLPRQVEGNDLDMEAVIRARVELAATGESSDRVYCATRTAERDLAVSILLDVSRSTESSLGTRSVLEVEREALIAMAWGLEACGDEAEIHAFSSLRRHRVYLRSCKAFDEKMGPEVEARIAGLTPGFYTRLGAAVRHVSKGLQARARQRRLLLVITDGKPNDLDHYEGRHGVEDSRKAIEEARRQGQSVFGITVDAKAQASFARIFGKNGFAVVPHPEKMSEALPLLYRHLVTG